MSISDKLLYLSKTKRLLREALNSILFERGEPLLTEQDAFREYAIRAHPVLSLFQNGEQGGYCLQPNAEAYFTDAAGTTPAALTNAVALVQGEVGPDWTQGTATARPIWAREPEGGRRNLVVANSEIGLPMASSGATTVSTGWTLFDNALLQGRRIPPSDGVALNYSYYQTTPPPVGTYRFSVYVRNEDGSPIVFGNPTSENSDLNPFAVVAYGTAMAANRLTIEELPSGIYRLSCTVTVGGNVNRGWGILRRTTHDLSAPAVIVSGWQIESGSVTTPYQRVNGASDITEPSVPDVPYVRFDLVDDVLTTTLPAATYTVALPTRQGIWIDSVEHAGGTFSIGPTSYTGGPAGILTALESDGVAKLIAPPLVIDRALTDAERNGLVRWYQSRGAGINMPVSGVLIGYFNAGQTTDPLIYSASTRTTTWFRVPEGASQGEFTADRGVFMDRFRVQLRDGAGVVTYAAPYGGTVVTLSAATLSIPPGTVDMRIYFTTNPDPAGPKFLMAEWS